MKKIKQILAWLGIILLLSMYGLTLFFALSDDPNSGRMLMASVYATIIIPVLLYAYLLIYRWKSKKDGLPEIDKEHSEIDTLIFDLGNVLADYNWYSFLKAKGYDEKRIKKIGEAVFLSEDWVEADRGVLTDEQLLETFIKNNPALEAEIRDTFATMGGTIKTFPYTQSWLQHLKKRGYKLYYLSNFSRPLFEQCREEMNFLQLMDGGYMSYEVNLIKPDPKYYQKLFHDFSINPKKAVFLDDVLENVAEARAQGLRSIHFKDKKEAIQKLMDDFHIQ